VREINDLDAKLAGTTAPPLLGAERPSCARAHGVCAAPTNPSRTLQTGLSAPTTPSQGNGARQIARGKQPAGQPPTLSAEQWAQTNRPEKIRPRADAQPSKRHMAGISRAVWLIKTMETVTRRSLVVPGVSPRCCNQRPLQRLDSESASNCAAPRWKVRRSRTRVSTARRARLPRPLAGTRGCHPA